MIASAALFTALLLQPESPADTPDLPPLVAGSAIEGTLTSNGGAIVHSPSARKPLHGIAFTLVADAPGPHTIEMHSFFFDPWLVLEDGSGTILAENDDGPIGRHARIVADLEEGRTYVRACASYGGEGPFTLRVTRGAPPPDPEGKDLWTACLADARAAFTALRDALPPEHHEMKRAYLALAAASRPTGDSSFPWLDSLVSLAVHESVTGHDDDVVRLLEGPLDGFEFDVDDPVCLRMWVSGGHYLAQKLAATGRIDEANAWCARIEQASRHLPEQDVETRDESMLTRERIAFASGDIDEGARILKQRVDLRRDPTGAYNASCIYAVHHQVSRLFEVGRIDEATVASDDLLDWMRSGFGEHPLLAATADLHITMLIDAARYLEAERAAIEFEPISERVLGRQHRITIELLARRGAALHGLGRVEGARQILAMAFQRSVAADVARRETVPSERQQRHFGRLTPRNDAEWAWSLLEAARVDHYDLFQTPSIALELSGVLEELGQPDEAVQLLAEVSRDPEWISPSLFAQFRQTYIYKLGASGDIDGALRACRELASLLERAVPHGDGTWVDVKILEADLLRRTGATTEAVALLSTLESLPVMAIAPKVRRSLVAEQSMALEAVGRLEDAFALERALDDGAGSDPYPNLRRAGVLARRLHRSEVAITLFDEAMARRREMSGASSLEGDLASAQVSMHTALAHHDMDRSGDAWESARAGTADSLAVLRRELPLASEANRLAHAARHLEIQDGLLALVRAIPAAERERETFHAVAAFRGLVGRGLASGKRALFADLDDEGRTALDELRAVQGALSAATLTRSTKYDPAMLRERRRVLEQELLRRGVATDLELPDASRLGAALPAGSALLLFALHEDPPFAGEFGVDATTRLSAWVLRAGEADARRIDLGDAVPIEDAVRAHLARLGLAQGADPADLAARGVGAEVLVAKESASATGASALTATNGSRAADPDPASLLWQPLANALDGADPVFVVPDGFLGALPFETIALDDGSFLLERMRFVYLDDPFDARTTTGAPTPSTQYGRALCVADVEYGDASDGARTWASLPGTAAEIAGILGVLQRAEATRSLLDATEPSSPWLLLTGTAATKERLAREMPAFSILHLATHGFFDPRIDDAWDAARKQAAPDARRDVAHLALAARQLPGLACGLVCANANAERAKGLARLTADEVGWLDLRECQIAVLSACETGLGRSTTGQGMTSLRRAFHHAGARTVVSSSWRVDDEATASLMVAFYANLLERGMSRLDALQHARLSLLAANRERFEDPLPHTWGAFVLSGEWR